MTNNELDNQTIQQICDVLLLNGGFLSNPGLYTGEMGLVLFFTHYARYTQNDLYFEYAYELMEKTQNKIHHETPIYYKHGLTGIGSVIEYLVQNGYFEAEIDDVLEDFDNRIFFTYNLQNLSIDVATDIAYYAAWRMSGTSRKKDMIQKNILSPIEQHYVLPKLCLNMPEFLVDKTYNRCLELISKNLFWSQDASLQDGLAGWGLSLLTELTGNNSWYSLFPNKLINDINK